ncbi:hypothetical protein LEP1GSC127_4310 [Leptospira kirschneri str. 200801925]|nr:hypothetical protein LEP1GSC127_4310 [Leptospira kirschneri str. 200801925]KXZ30789.1 hypothetical protein AYB34_15615 [Leptospira sp. ZV016]
MNFHSQILNQTYKTYKMWELSHPTHFSFDFLSLYLFLKVHQRKEYFGVYHYDSEFLLNKRIAFSSFA